MSMPSSSFQWELIRNNHSFLHRRNGVSLSSEPGNLLGVHSFKFNGLVNNRVLNVESDSKGKIKLYRARVGNENLQKVKGKFEEINLNSSVRQGRSMGAKAIDSKVRRAFYRRDLQRFAVGKFHRLTQANKNKKNPIAQKLNKRQQKAKEKNLNKKSQKTQSKK